MKEKSNKIIKEILDLLKSAIISIILVVLLTQFVIKPIQIDGQSMQPTLLDEQRGFSNILAHSLTDIKRFEIVIIYDEVDDDYYVKRVVGLENEVIEVKDDVLYINGNAVEQPFLDIDYINQVTNNQSVAFTNDFGPVKIRDGYVFVMGDNRINSTDSRMRGPYKIDNIISKHIYILFPFDEMRFYYK